MRMTDIAPWMTLLPALAAGIVLVIGGWWLETEARMAHRVATIWAAGTIRQRILVGHALALPVAGAAVIADSLAGLGSWGWIIGIGVYLYLGWTAPRRPLIERHRRRRAITRLLPAFLTHIWIGMHTNDPPLHVLQSFITNRPDRRLEPMQQVVRDTLLLVTQERLLPFAALHRAAEPYQVEALSDAAMVLAQAEREGQSPLDALERLREGVERAAYESFRLSLERKKLAMIGVSAISVLSIVVQILFVAVFGSPALSAFI